MHSAGPWKLAVCLYGFYNSRFGQVFLGLCFFKCSRRLCLGANGVAITAVASLGDTVVVASNQIKEDNKQYDEDECDKETFLLRCGGRTCKNPGSDSS